MTAGAALFAAEACVGSHPRAANGGGTAAVVRPAPTDESTRERTSTARDLGVDGKLSSVEKIARLRVDSVDHAR